MNRGITLTQHVNAAAEKVWAVISDVPGSAATLSGIDAIEMLSDGPYGKGTRWKETRTMMRRSETVEMWVTQSDPPRSTTVKALQVGVDYTSGMTLTDRDGGTDLTVTFGAELTNPSRTTKIGMALFGKLGMRMTRKALARDLAEIAARAESL
ncbi:SRPBCC family protein [Arthrobacter sp. TB 23]|uniref:SRPBCC family protein n=1 Tax=Arthrobacter sp. TB 23 TaxID=494419 RepID=UPI000315C820|nr:SRPBCC family protein [Arthrobacter sp. TB 23]